MIFPSDFLFGAFSVFRARVLVISLSIVSACAPAKRPGEEMDSGTDTDTGSDNGLPWDPDAGDALVHKPVCVFEDPYSGCFMSMAFDDNYIAISFSDIEFNPPNTVDPIEFNTLFLVFPWDSPEDVMTGWFAQEPPACPSNYSWYDANSKPHPHPDGFLLLTSATGNEYSGCELVQTLWDTGANLLGGPHTFSGLFPDKVFQAMDPNGMVDADGVVTVGHLKGVGFDEDGDTDTDGEGEVVLDVDRFGSDGFHERLTHAVFPWPDTPDVDNRIISSASGRNVYLNGGVYTALGMELNSGDPNDSAVLLTRVTTDGEVLQPPTKVLGLPPTPQDLEWTNPFAWFNFTSLDNSIAVLAQNQYLPSEEEYEHPIDDPYPIGLWFRLIDFDGMPLCEWNHLVEYDSHIHNNKPRMVWSGQYFGACYNDPYDTHKFLVLDENGEKVMEPIDLFWPIPPVENRILPCDVLAVDEDTFVISMSVYTEPEQEYANGVWVTRVDVTIVD